MNYMFLKSLLGGKVPTKYVPSMSAQHTPSIYTFIFLRIFTEEIHSIAPYHNHHNYIPTPYPSLFSFLNWTLNQIVTLK